MFVVANIVDAVAQVAHMLIGAYVFVVLAACVVSWLRVDPWSQPVRILRSLTEPVFGRIRQHRPFLCLGGMDFTPVAAIVLLELFDLILVRSLAQLARAM